MKPFQFCFTNKIIVMQRKVLPLLTNTGVVCPHLSCADMVLHTTMQPTYVSSVAKGLRERTSKAS